MRTLKSFWNIETDRLSRFTFWIVFAQAVLVITLLGLTLLNVSRNSTRAEIQATANETLIESNAILITELRENQSGQRLAMVESIFCMLEVVPQDRTTSLVNECLDIFLTSESAPGGFLHFHNNNDPAP